MTIRSNNRFGYGTDPNAGVWHGGIPQGEPQPAQRRIGTRPAPTPHYGGQSGTSGGYGGAMPVVGDALGKRVENVVHNAAKTGLHLGAMQFAITGTADLGPGSVPGMSDVMAGSKVTSGDFDFDRVVGETRRSNALATTGDTAPAKPGSQHPTRPPFVMEPTKQVGPEGNPGARVMRELGPGPSPQFGGGVRDIRGDLAEAAQTPLVGGKSVGAPAPSFGTTDVNTRRTDAQKARKRGAGGRIQGMLDKF